MKFSWHINIVLSSHYSIDRLQSGSTHLVQWAFQAQPLVRHEVAQGTHFHADIKRQADPSQKYFRCESFIHISGILHSGFHKGSISMKPTKTYANYQECKVVQWHSKSYLDFNLFMFALSTARPGQAQKVVCYEDVLPTVWIDSNAIANRGSDLCSDCLWPK